MTEKYDLLRVKLNDGEVVKGYLLREDKTHIVLAKSGKGNQGAEPLYIVKEGIKWQKNLTVEKEEDSSAKVAQCNQITSMPSTFTI